MRLFFILLKNLHFFCYMEQVNNLTSLQIMSSSFYVLFHGFHFQNYFNAYGVEEL